MFTVVKKGYASDGLEIELRIDHSTIELYGWKGNSFGGKSYYFAANHQAQQWYEGQTTVAPAHDKA